MPRLTWKLDEKRQVALQAAILRRSDNLLPIRDALYRAQAELPEDRRKARMTWALERAMIRRVEILESNPRALPPIPEVAAPAPAEPPAPPPEHPLVIAVREFGAMLGAAIAKELAPHLALALAGAPKTNGNGNGAHHNGHELPKPGDEIISRLPAKFVQHKVAIMGLLPDQQNAIKASFPHIDFRWLEGRASGDTVRAVAKQCEAVFLMTKFISHGRQDKVPGDKRVLVNGGVSSLERLVGARYPRSTSIEPERAH